jgi:release factor glutamine methyltransferase
VSSTASPRRSPRRSAGARSSPTAAPDLTVRAALARAADFLARHGVESPRVDAEWLLAHALGLSRIGLYTEHDRPLTPGDTARARELLARRARREPLAYVLGEWGFRKLTLTTDRRALIPRPETEVVVDRCLALLEGADRPRVLDVGTGTGAIALAIAQEHPGARVTGVDTSPDALALARENAARTGVEAEFRPGGFEAAEDGWDLVVSNPPYVTPAEYETLEPELREWEPRGALVGEGLHAELAARVRGGWLALETGDGQAAAVAAALEGLGFAAIRITPDLNGCERVVEGRRDPVVPDG